MTNLEKFNSIISDVFSIEEEDIKDELGPDEIEEWDSLNHIELVTNLEEKFKISFAVEDISRMYTIGDIKTILKKYGVEI